MTWKRQIEYVSVLKNTVLFFYPVFLNILYSVQAPKNCVCVPRFLSSSLSRLWKVVCGDSQGYPPSRFMWSWWVPGDPKKTIDLMVVLGGAGFLRHQWYKNYSKPKGDKIMIYHSGVQTTKVSSIKIHIYIYIYPYPSISIPYLIYEVLFCLMLLPV